MPAVIIMGVQWLYVDATLGAGTQVPINKCAARHHVLLQASLLLLAGEVGVGVKEKSTQLPLQLQKRRCSWSCPTASLMSDSEVKKNYSK